MPIKLYPYQRGIAEAHPRIERVTVLKPAGADAHYRRCRRRITAPAMIIRAAPLVAAAITWPMMGPWSMPLKTGIRV